MEFKFGFFGQEDEVENVANQEKAATQHQHDDIASGVFPCTVIPAEFDPGCETQAALGVDVEMNVGIRLVQSKDLSLEADENVTSETDVKPGLYEGGFKLWEGSVDLARYLAKHKGDVGPGKVVLDLGCGHGIPGVYCAVQGASVWFQDLNKEVLIRHTMKNVQLNLSSFGKLEDGWTEKHKFVSGDWRNLDDSIFSEGQFDVILSAETVYNTELYPELHRIFQRYLGRNGVVLVAAKRFYFGVGGGGNTFQEYVVSRGVFEIGVVSVFEDGASNVRDIFSLRFKNVGK